MNLRVTVCAERGRRARCGHCVRAHHTGRYLGDRAGVAYARQDQPVYFESFASVLGSNPGITIAGIKSGGAPWVVKHGFAALKDDGSLLDNSSASAPVANIPATRQVRTTAATDLFIGESSFSRDRTKFASPQCVCRWNRLRAESKPERSPRRNESGFGSESMGLPVSRIVCNA